MTTTHAIELPTWESYGNYASKNYGANALRFWLPNGLSIWFSYKTPVAFATSGRFVIRENDWSTTTGRHLNAIDPDKSKRVSGDEFERQLSEVLAP